MSMNGDKDGAQPKVTIRLMERQETILKEAQKSTGVSFGSLIRKCIDMNIKNGISFAIPTMSKPISFYDWNEIM